MEGRLTMCRCLTNSQALNNHEPALVEDAVTSTANSSEEGGGDGVAAATRSVSVGSAPPSLPNNKSFTSFKRIPCLASSLMVPDRIRSSFEGYKFALFDRRRGALLFLDRTPKAEVSVKQNTSKRRRMG